jgi:Kef-type K+ transport system membrane component KefB
LALSLQTVLAAMVLGNYVIKDDGWKHLRCFGGIGLILLPMFIAGFEFYLNHRNNDRKKFQIMPKKKNKHKVL